MLSTDPYMVWYRRITRRYITRDSIHISVDTLITGCTSAYRNLRRDIVDTFDPVAQQTMDTVCNNLLRAITDAGFGDIADDLRAEALVSSPRRPPSSRIPTSPPLRPPPLSTISPSPPVSPPWWTSIASPSASILGQCHPLQSLMQPGFSPRPFVILPIIIHRFMTHWPDLHDNLHPFCLLSLVLLYRKSPALPKTLQVHRILKYLLIHLQTMTLMMIVLYILVFIFTSLWTYLLFLMFLLYIILFSSI